MARLPLFTPQFRRRLLCSKHQHITKNHFFQHCLCSCPVLGCRSAKPRAASARQPVPLLRSHRPRRQRTGSRQQRQQRRRFGRPLAWRRLPRQHRGVSPHVAQRLLLGPSGRRRRSGGRRRGRGKHRPALHRLRTRAAGGLTRPVAPSSRGAANEPPHPVPSRALLAAATSTNVAAVPRSLRRAPPAASVGR